MNHMKEKIRSEKPVISEEDLAKWRKAIAAQQEIASHPRSQQEAEEYARQISHIPFIELLRRTTV